MRRHKWVVGEFLTDSLLSTVLTVSVFCASILIFKFSVRTCQVLARSYPCESSLLIMMTWLPVVGFDSELKVLTSSGEVMCLLH